MSDILDSFDVNGQQYEFADANARARCFDLEKHVSNLRAYLNMPGMENVIGIQVDYANKTFKRLAAADGLSIGSDFDKFPMYGGRKRCNLGDDGVINAFYGDSGYTEDGSNGQVMVYQPKFYYMVVPVKYEKNTTTGYGYHLRCCNYYVSNEHLPGFKLHPMFIDKDGNELDAICVSAYEGSLWDASAGAYITDDSQVMDTSVDKLCSIANVKPASGLSQNLTRPNLETLAQNRGVNWHSDLIKVECGEMLLMIIEMGAMNSQDKIGQGVVSISDSNSYNCSSLTGSTSSLGNGTGIASQTINEKGGTTTVETANGKTSVTWRGKENPWGNIWKFVYGVNIYGNGKMGGGMPYICKDFNFAESKNSGNYEGAGFTVTNASGYISAMGYGSDDYDWLFMASECVGNSSLPVGDYHYVTSNLNGYRIALLGGCWGDGVAAGLFFWALFFGVGYRYRYIGGRLVYIGQITLLSSTSDEAA